ncbi:hypothetical protein [Pedobacter sp. Leaf170]|uniref:hypothetical protein n=1 Tax=Pedobacter sp. Leaf170 TaxID=2876558 RepID=UPI001E2861D6|nr:hypothetical protein [Pedobacter sp. Leaf170]
MEKLINILKSTLKDYPVIDIVQSGGRTLDIIVSTKEDAKSIRNMAELIHEDSEIKIKDIQINFVDQHGTRFER